LLAERLILFAICMQMISSLRTEGTGWCIDSGRFDAVGVCYWGHNPSQKGVGKQHLWFGQRVRWGKDFRIA
jgi:hypothetical protein